MMNFRPILEVVGILLTIIAAVMLLPLLVDAIDNNPDWHAFALSSLFTFFVGISLWLINRDHNRHFNTRQAFVLTTASWVAIPAFSALPFIFTTPSMSYTDAFFEAMSGFTSCGATVITDLENTPDGILLWRALLNWIGGIGIIVVAVAILPMLKVGGMQLFKMESSDKSEKIFPRATQFASALITLYGSFTLLVAIGLWMAGMDVFDAIYHAMTAMATGGFSTHSNSIGYFDSVAIEIIIIITMIVSCLPFVLYIQAAQGSYKPLWRDSQVRWFLGILAFGIISVALWLQLKNGMTFWEGMRYSAFNVTSIMTTTGFSSTNYALWGSYPVCLLFVLSLIGGCTGSTAGAIKVFRIQMLLQAVKVQMKQLVHPHGVFRMHFNNKPVADGVINSILIFFFVYIAIFMAFTLLLSTQGVDFLTSTSAIASTMAAAGYGLGDIIGPTGSYKPISEIGKWILCAAMIMGRLEFFTILVLFSPNFWRS